MENLEDRLFPILSLAKLDTAARSYDQHIPEGYSAQASLAASKTAWEAFRDAQCDYEYTEYIDGTMRRSIVGAGCLKWGSRRAGRALCWARRGVVFLLECGSGGVSSGRWRAAGGRRTVELAQLDSVR
jgi:hypothetical protein